MLLQKTSPLTPCLFLVAITTSIKTGDIFLLANATGLRALNQPKQPVK